MSISPLNDEQKHNISVGVKRALHAKMLRGELVGRPIGIPKLDGKKNIIARRIGKGIKAKRVASDFDVSQATLSRWMKYHKIKIQ